MSHRAASVDAPPLEFDIEALRARYAEERDKRRRPDGNAQYVEVTGDFSHYVDDPYVEPGFSRAGMAEEVEVLILGGGFAGLSAGAQLVMAGFKDIRIVEKGGDFGGVWYWNRYPGAQCDTDAYVYLPLLEETGYLPTQKYIFGDEIQGHAQRIGRTFGLYERALFQTQVKEMRWIEAESKWLVSTDRGDAIKAHFVIQTVGVLDRPKLPGIPGINGFRGHTFHTSRWDYGYTGGDIHGNLSKLADKRVAVIGTGCSAIQCVPHVGEAAKHLYVFQRTPSSIDLRNNSYTDPTWAKSLAPGWHQRRRENFVALTSGIPQPEDLVNDGWTEAVRNVGGFFAISGETNLSADQIARQVEIADFRKMNQLRARIDEIVKDRKTAEALKPWYRQFCKRPTFSDNYLPTFNRPNVTLVDTKGRGVDRITETAVVFDDVAYDVDCIVFATGFEVGTSLARRTGSQTIGRDGKSLSQEWAHGMRTLHGFYTHDFPNLFQMGLGQNGVSYVFTYPIDEQAKHIAAVIGEIRRRRANRFEPTAQAEAEWVKTIRSMSGPTREFQRDCTPGYYNNEGKRDELGGVIDEAFGGGPQEFFALVNKWRADGMPGLAIS
ncbi:MAG: NAD(P)/FAD-dependent oxidoreductase [Alphaproteobacteria bacterium]|nr:NAD(P)/FAD-dependent oxidoreductase [Alphaproteobacteria bacterium]